MINIEELRTNKKGDIYDEGFRIVYYTEDNYEIGEYCKTIEGFMIGFADNYPIISDDEIPKIISNEDLLNRYLEELLDVTAVAVYNINGDCVCKKSRNLLKD